MGVDRMRASLTGLALAAAVASGPAFAVPVVVDGVLTDDWGITVKNGNGGGVNQVVGGNTITFNNSSGTNYGGARPTGFQLQDGVEGYAWGMPGAQLPVGLPTSWSEDIYDGTNDEIVDPNYGGQNYDAEWMGAAYVEATNTLSLAILSGVRQDNGFSKYGPGDIRFVAHYDSGPNKEFALEVGGGVGNTANTNLTINKGDAGTTYGLTSGGSTERVITLEKTANPTIFIETLFTNGGGTSTTNVPECSNGSGTGSGTGGGVSNGYGINEGQTAGSIWRMDNSDWILDPISSTAGISSGGNQPAQIGCGAEKVGEANEFKYKQTSGTGSAHAVIELSINLSLFGNFTDLDIYWGPACGNDKLGFEWPREFSEVPAPAGLWVLSTALLGLAALRRRRRI